MKRSTIYDYFAAVAFIIFIFGFVFDDYLIYCIVVSVLIIVITLYMKVKDDEKHKNDGDEKNER